MAKREWDTKTKQWMVDDGSGVKVPETQLKAQAVMRAHQEAQTAVRDSRNALIARRAEFEAALADGRSVWIYDYVYVPIDSKVYQRPIDPTYDRSTIASSGIDLGPVNDRSIHGWSVVASIPRTMAEVYAFQGTSNFGLGAGTGHTLMTGLSGTVIGSYIVMGRQITAADIPAVWGMLNSEQQAAGTHAPTAHQGGPGQPPPPPRS